MSTLGSSRLGTAMFVFNHAAFALNEMLILNVLNVIAFGRGWTTSNLELQSLFSRSHRTPSLQDIPVAPSSLCRERFDIIGASCCPVMLGRILEWDRIVLCWSISTMLSMTFSERLSMISIAALNVLV